MTHFIPILHNFLIVPCEQNVASKFRQKLNRSGQNWVEITTLVKFVLEL